MSQEKTEESATQSWRDILRDITAARNRPLPDRDSLPFVFGHEMPHSMSSGVGKTNHAKAVANALGFDLVDVDMTPDKSGKDLRDFMGPPPRYVLSSEQEAGLAAGIAELKEKWRRKASKKSGEELAAACHGGVAQETACLKPFRLKNANNGFTAVGAAWQ